VRKTTSIADQIRSVIETIPTDKLSTARVIEGLVQRRVAVTASVRCQISRLIQEQNETPLSPEIVEAAVKLIELAGGFASARFMLTRLGRFYKNTDRIPNAQEVLERIREAVEAEKEE
jgi:hypothetical protein